ncbi:hypothetical protein EXIGLDRAFT_347230 [Exidia glandulosa HHB12029]|uniref:Uncharacterized protein n=1 Tax=Exidia glandulosa HHB12029 TaxID=1314781 RepID=A0A165CFB5_EXIGL|nr:hypothetical protein EXIGLDRAFT_347230 [Exidia glandulosa HHB12029]
MRTRVLSYESPRKKRWDFRGEASRSQAYVQGAEILLPSGSAVGRLSIGFQRVPPLQTLFPAGPRRLWTPLLLVKRHLVRWREDRRTRPHADTLTRQRAHVPQLRFKRAKTILVWTCWSSCGPSSICTSSVGEQVGITVMVRLGDHCHFFCDTQILFWGLRDAAAGLKPTSERLRETRTDAPISQNDGRDFFAAAAAEEAPGRRRFAEVPKLARTIARKLGSGYDLPCPPPNPPCSANSVCTYYDCARKDVRTT